MGTGREPSSDAGSWLLVRDRAGRTRTCNPRFWRPVLCQLSYGPSAGEKALYRGASKASRSALRRSGAGFGVVGLLRGRGGRRGLGDRGRGGPPRRSGWVSSRTRCCGRKAAESSRRADLPFILCVMVEKPNGHAGPLARVQAHRRQGAARPADPHVRAAREVRRRASGERPAGARGGGRPRLLRPARADRRHRALRPQPRHQVRDVRDRADQGLDHRRAALDGLGAALGARTGARDRAHDRAARGEAGAGADRRGDRRPPRHHRGRVPGFAARDLPDVDRRARRAVDKLVHRRRPRGC